MDQEKMTTSPFILPSYKFHGSSTNIVKDHVIEKDSLSRRASQQLSSYILRQNRSKYKMSIFIKSLSLICVISLFYYQFSQGSAINSLIHNNFQYSIPNSGRLVYKTVDLSETNELLDPIFAIITKNEPVFEEPVSISSDKVEILQSYKKKTNSEENVVLTESKLRDEAFLNLNEQQESLLSRTHSNLMVNIFSKMHNLIKIYHQYFEYGQNGIIVYNDYGFNFQESIILSRVTVDSILKTSSRLPIQVIFHHVDDPENRDFKKLCGLNQVECVHLQSQALRTKYQQVNDSILRKISILISNKFDKLITIESGSIALNKLDDVPQVPNQNMIFWSELNDKRLTSPAFYTITDNDNVYGHKREKVRQGKDETYKYFIAPEHQSDSNEVAFHDLENTLVDSTTDASILFVNKKTNLNVFILSMYYDFYSSIYYPLLMSSLPSPLAEPATTQDVFSNSTIPLKKENSFTETLLASSFILNSKYYQVVRSQESINNGAISFNPVQDQRYLSNYFSKDLKKFLPSSLQIEAKEYDSNNFYSYMNKDAETKPLIISNIDYIDIFSKEKFFNNVFDHETLLNNNEVDPDLILSDLMLSLKKVF